MLKSNKHLLKILFALLCLIFTVLITIGWSVIQLIRPGELTVAVHPKDLEWEFENVAFETSDGLTIRGWFVPSENQEAEGVVVMLHGYPSNKASVLDMSLPLHSDYDLLLFDFRYFGDSDGWMSSLGLNEGKDLDAALNWLEAKGEQNIGVYGFSMGGAVALLAADNPRVDAIAARAPISDFGQMGELYFSRFGKLSPVFSKIAINMGKVLFGFDTEKINAYRQVRKLKKPILIIHDENDKSVPVSQSKRLVELMKNKSDLETYYYSSLGHNRIDPDSQLLVEDRLVEFFEKYLSKKQ